MKQIIVHKISLEAYNVFREAGYDISFYLPKPIKKVYSSGIRIRPMPYKEPRKLVRAKIETQIKTPYAKKHPKKVWNQE